MQHGKLCTDRCPRIITEGSTSSPATIRRRSTRSRALGDLLCCAEQSEDLNKDIDQARVNLLRDLAEWLEECQHRRMHPQALLVNQIRNLQETWYRASTVFLLTSRRTENAKYARGPRSLGLLAEHVVQYNEQKNAVT